MAPSRCIKCTRTCVDDSTDGGEREKERLVVFVFGRIESMKNIEREYECSMDALLVVEVFAQPVYSL